MPNKKKKAETAPVVHGAPSHEVRAPSKEAQQYLDEIAKRRAAMLPKAEKKAATGKRRTSNVERRTSKTKKK